ncbi:hypothetical protein [Alteromonas gilva]|uniref:Lipoprotein n=1 Tax=Alteromonas gilva TaxID=2987522 RepID=A0ABT5L7C4_9ALTE|nr:hypothetical protein [Alteromonas gilva]MDC8832950.1 hypothetical protein [Alteromonas gilva]
MTKLLIRKTVPSFFIIAGTLALCGCNSTPESNLPQRYEAWSEFVYKGPVLNNRFPGNRGGNSGGSLTVLYSEETETTVDYQMNMDTITRCEGAEGVCRHGVIIPKVHFTVDKSNLDMHQVFISGVFSFEVSKEGLSQSATGYVKKSISEGFPLLPLEKKEIEFSGVTGKGEVIVVKGPYDTSFSYSLKIE